ncbi:hypothetical protein [Paenibacillus jilunlii]|uniref:Uncharacterized protein n=1 Tax=Paenibacillus jilunlii TaxID=682956 RepID=A0A1G9PDG9_9BACL|nr:hypothetical protein [Paenibacillus jilunlii]KWX70698.1 hypothetical protein AML91_26985 [Paenibacillus jilunlii]SDL96846.1 hypothetical protein SAMN05216191_107154 [Paenibacillus jilunlii]
MPLITPGGKYIYGWLKVKEDRTLYLPDEPLEEYGIQKCSKLFIMSGSGTSGGFSVMSRGMLEAHKSYLLDVLKKDPVLFNQTEEGYIYRTKQRIFSWVYLDERHYISFPENVLEAMGVCIQDELLSIRSSNVAFVNILQGPIVDRARKSTELKHYS